MSVWRSGQNAGVRTTAFISGLVALCLPVFSSEFHQRDHYRRPTFIPFPEEAPYNREVAALGKMLFFDTRLSGAQNMNCVSCHNPSFGWEAPVALSIGALNQPLDRHAPTLYNLAWGTSYFWDGRAATLEEQAVGPITDTREMGATFEMIIERLSSVQGYRSIFARLFPDQGITKNTILRAIATYERTIVSGVSSFDRWVEGDETAISAAAKRGFDLFTGDASCSTCHTGWNFSDNQLHDTGLPKREGDVGTRFKTPGLRSIALRAPFMHDGSLSSLTEVIQHYALGGAPNITREADITPFVITDEGVSDLIEFLNTLTEENSDVRSPILPAN